MEHENPAFAASILPKPPQHAGAAGRFLHQEIAAYPQELATEERFRLFWRGLMTPFVVTYGWEAILLTASASEPVMRWLFDLYGSCLDSLYATGPSSNPYPAVIYTEWASNSLAHALLIQAAHGPLAKAAVDFYQERLAAQDTAASSAPQTPPTPPAQLPSAATSSRSSPRATLAAPTSDAPTSAIPQSATSATVSASIPTARKQSLPPEDSRYVLIRHFGMPLSVRAAIRTTADLRKQVITEVRVMLKAWGYSVSLVDEASLYVLPRSGDLRLTFTTTAKARAFLDGRTSKAATRDGQPIRRSRGDIMATLVAPPPMSPTGYGRLVHLVDSAASSPRPRRPRVTNPESAAAAATSVGPVTAPSSATGHSEEEAKSEEARLSHPPPRHPAAPSAAPSDDLVLPDAAVLGARTATERSPTSSPPRRLRPTAPSFGTNL
jgi:hypothetical protein